MRLDEAAEIAAIVAGIVAATTLVAAVVRWVWARWRKRRSKRVVPVATRIGEAIHYGPMSGAWAAAPARLANAADPETCFSALKRRGDLSFLEYTPFSLWISNTSKRKRNVLHLREIWLSLEDFTSLEVAKDQQPLAVNVSTVAAGGRGADHAFGGTIHTSEPVRVPLLASSAAADQQGSFRISVEGGDDCEIELELAAAEEGRYVIKVSLDIEWKGKTYTVDINPKLVMLSCRNLDWADGFAHSFAW